MSKVYSCINVCLEEPISIAPFGFGAQSEPGSSTFALLLALLVILIEVSCLFQLPPHQMDLFDIVV